MNKNYQQRPLGFPSVGTSPTMVRVLLIEDDYSDAELFQFMLEDTELLCDVSVATTLSQGLEFLGSEREFDVILLDLTLPDSHGMDTLHSLLFSFPNANVIVLTGNSNQKQGTNAVGSGAQDFLVKGDFDPKKLAKSVRFSMERKQIATRLEDTQRLAKIGHWELQSSNEYFDAGNEVYRFFGLDPTKERFSYFDIQSKTCPFYILRTHELQFIDQEEHSQTIHWQDAEGNYSYGQITSKRTITAEGYHTYLGSLQDITIQRKAEELERAQELAEETARVREQVIANVSHELRTPMNAILGMSNVMDKSNFDERQVECIENIQEASQVLLSIINDILLTSSLQNSKEKFDPAPFDIALTTRRISEALNPKATSKGLELSYEVNPLLPQYLIGDKQRLSQVLYNLIGNAIKFTEKGKVEIKVFPESIDEYLQWVIIEVHDTGFGIEESKVKEIFQPFSRIKTPGKNIEGTGLGLTIAQQIAHQMGGEIKLSSVVDKGSVFSIVLPFEYTDELEKKEFENGHNQQKKSSIKLVDFESVMIVEDHPMNQLVIRRTLEKEWPELQIYVAESGELAIEMLESLQVDLILMDLQLPGMSGYDTTKLIRTQLTEKYRNTPILAMTAQPKVANDNSYREVGMNDYILKPFDPNTLFEKITQHLING